MLTSLPNLLTLSRIAVIPVLLLFLYLNEPWARWTALFLFIAAGLTDWLDGYLARNWGQVSAIGRFLDPIADKLLVAAVILLLVAIDGITGLVLLPALVILCREILVSGLYSEEETEVVAAAKEGLRAIGEALFISARSVEKHISAIFSKLGLTQTDDVHRRVQAVLIFLGMGGANGG